MKSSVVWPTLYNVEYALVLKVKEQSDQETELHVTGVFEYSTFIQKISKKIIVFNAKTETPMHWR